ncbi:arsenate reductase family protein [Gemelliphila palaticanis]|uniref:Arsenate reductase family protein n=1 Tax=Gemelliphila palaticanis TaxID=81950 RepID=A0ABX2SZR5_9BACL|nr:arsenate reductase family protein [Gemella palaticanis]MBF0715943.1 arsenate reductase family protein [Gemella palaticanis]NYS47873.1 arsenate reductase family protein [Gemella palaticanis]
MKIYEYPKCSTCRAAKKFIKEHNINAEFIDITKEQPSKEEIKNILKTFNIPLKKLFNTSGVKYKELKLKDVLPNISEDEAIDILLSDGMLIKRPLAFHCSQETLLLGFKEDEWSAALTAHKFDW